MPRALIEAHRNGSLVIFVGAGASRAAPSGLPDFRRLAADVAADVSVDVTDDQLEQPDVLLGDLEDRQASTCTGGWLTGFAWSHPGLTDCTRRSRPWLSRVRQFGS